MCSEQCNTIIAHARTADVVVLQQKVIKNVDNLHELTLNT